MRAAELALNAVPEMLDHLLNVSGAGLAISLKKAASEDDVNIIMSDWETGRQLLLFVVTTKMACWGELPLALCCLSHHDEAKARLGACEVLARFDHLGDAHPHHVLAITHAQMHMGSDCGRGPCNEYAHMVCP